MREVLASGGFELHLSGSARPHCCKSPPAALLHPVCHTDSHRGAQQQVHVKRTSAHCVLLGSKDTGGAEQDRPLQPAKSALSSSRATR